MKVVLLLLVVITAFQWLFYRYVLWRHARGIETPVLFKYYSLPMVGISTVVLLSLDTPVFDRLLAVAVSALYLYAYLTRTADLSADNSSSKERT